MKRASTFSLFLAMSLAACCGLRAQTADDPFLGTRWDKPGPKKAANAPPLGGTFGPGEANWSIMPAGIGIEPFLRTVYDGDHPLGDATRPFDSLLPGEPAGTAEGLVKKALDLWSVSSVSLPGSGFKVLPKAADGMGLAGHGPADPPNDPTDGTAGDIRVGVYAWTMPAPTIDPPADAIAHAFYPDTHTQHLFYDVVASVGGDIHLRPHAFGIDGIPGTIDDEPNGVEWINWKMGDPMPGPGELDLFTVVLHEVGHAIGLGHNLDLDSGMPKDPMSVMVPTYPGVRQALSATDIANVQLLYSIPEPAAVVLFTTVMACLGARRHRQPLVAL